MSRWSLKNVVRQVRGARGAAARAEVRYHRNDVVTLLIRRAVKALNAAEAHLLDARTRALAGAVKRDRRAA